MTPRRIAAVLAVLCAGTLASPALAADANAPSHCGTRLFRFPRPRRS